MCPFKTTIKSHPIVKLTATPLTPPYERIFINGDELFDAFLTDIAHAQQTIDLETYIYQKDHLGQTVCDALIAAAHRGVRVRVLVDGAGSPLWGTQFAPQLEAAGITSRVFHPFPWQLWNWSLSVVKLPRVLKWIYLLLKVNSRNHRKVCVIDRKTAYIGSVNIKACHLSEKNGGEGWRDTSVRITGIHLNGLMTAFEYAWTHRPIKARIRDSFRQVRQHPKIRLNYARHHRRIHHRFLLRRLAHASTRIWITNAYFVPDNMLLKKIKEAADRGVDVRILLPKKSDIRMMPWASSTFYYSLLKSGIRIFEYQPNVLHAKSVIIDDWMIVGSSNLNYRSLLHDLEVDIEINLPAAQQQLTKAFIIDLEQSKEIELSSWKAQRPWYQRWLGRCVLYLKYWI